METISSNEWRANIFFHLCDSRKIQKWWFNNTWPLEGNQNADVALGENEFDTPGLDAQKATVLRGIEGRNVAFFYFFIFKAQSLDNRM